MAFWNRRQQMGWAAIIMGASIFLSRFMGLIREKFISYLFGATTESDIYFAAFVIPDFITYLLAGGYFSITLIPFLADFFERDEEDGWRFFSSVFCWLGIVITILTAGAMIFADRLAEVAAPGLPPTSLARLAFFLRIIMPAQICFLLGSCFTAVLYLRKQFFVPALSPLLYNFFIILGGILLRSRGMEGFCWGVLAGAFIGSLLLPWLAASQGEGLKLGFSLRHPGLKKYLYTALPLMIGQSIVVLDEQLVRVFGSLSGPGAVSWLSYARRIMLVPVGVVAQAAGVASYPFFAELAAKKDFSKFSKTLRDALQNVLTLLAPLSILMIAISEPVIRLIFQQGRFGPGDTAETTLLLQILLAVVFCWGFQQVLGRAFYAMQDTLTPAVLGTITTILFIPVYYLLAKRMQAVGVAAASALSIAVYTGLIAWRWKRRIGGEAFLGLGIGFAKASVLSLIAVTPAVAIVKLGFLTGPGHPYLGAVNEIVAGGVSFGALFTLLSVRFIPSLVAPFLRRTGPLGRKLLGRDF